MSTVQFGAFADKPQADLGADYEGSGSGDDYKGGG